jgi:DNA repair protein RecO (recombination protein O)
MSDRERVELEPGFILHQRPYRNTSQLLECLTASRGRVGLVARGSRRPGRGERAVLQPFAPLMLSWVRRGELGRLTAVEARAYTPAVEAQSLLAGFYLNELMLRLLARDDANSLAFSCYSQCLADLAAGKSTARAVRLFEFRFLRALGYGLDLGSDAQTGEPVKPESRYLFELERGLRIVENPSPGTETYGGMELISLREEALQDEQSLLTAKRLLGRVLRSYLGGKPLRSRSVLKDIFERGLQG